MLVVAGAGGLGREVLDVALALDQPVTAFLDDARAGETVRGVPVLPPDEAPTGAGFVVGIADAHARRRLAALLVDRGLVPRELVHPAAGVAPEVVRGAGVLLLAGCYVSSSVLLGDHAQVHYLATVGHDAELGAYVTVLPGARVGGAVSLGAGSTVGSGAVLLQGLRIGDGAFVGAGAVVTRDVEAGAVVVGNPARRLR